MTVTHDMLLEPGTPVLLPDNTLAYASPDRRIGARWNGTYRINVRGVLMIGWLREQLRTAEDIFGSPPAADAVTVIAKRPSPARVLVIGVWL